MNGACQRRHCRDNINMKRRGALLCVSVVTFIVSAAQIAISLSVHSVILAMLQSAKDGRDVQPSSIPQHRPIRDTRGIRRPPIAIILTTKGSSIAVRNNGTLHGKISVLKRKVFNAGKGQYFPLNITYANQPVNPHNYKLIINEPDLCRDGSSDGAQIYMLILMLSKPSNILQRNRQRESCLSVSKVSGRRVKSLFLLGTPKYDSVIKTIYKESNKYRDVVMEDFIDSYRNLTLKTIMGLKWASMYCKHASWVMKVDDDVLFNLPVFVEYLESLGGKQTIAGKIQRDKPPVRSPTSHKWYVTREEYRHDVYPAYPNGPCYVISGKVVPKLYDESTMIPILPMEDVFAGILAARRNVTLVDYPPVARKYNQCTVRGVMVIHGAKVKQSQFKKVWGWMMLPKNETCE